MAKKPIKKEKKHKIDRKQGRALGIPLAKMQNTRRAIYKTKRKLKKNK